MPTKFSATQKTVARGTKTVVTQNFYIKNTSKEELIEYINNGQKPKIKQKCRNELARRGIEIVWVDKNANSE
jgi:hypothetical protein|tara:strand:- start:1217 stop:1432 length:216 start_codon:yes stop_codon:yes gene_type:complete